jgi:hypothetical protein
MSKDDEEEDKYITYFFEKKITLTEEEKTRLIFHTFTNIINVLLGIILLRLIFCCT